jgi:hypothetical protein
VLAADRAIIEQAVQSHYRTILGEAASSEELRRQAREYLEKIIQLPLTLPPLAREEATAFWRNEPWPLNDIPAPTWGQTAEEAFRTAQPLFEAVIARNPREIKRAKNLFRLDWLVARQRGLKEPKGENLKVFGLLTFLRLYNPDLYELLPDYPNMIDLLIELASATNKRAPAAAEVITRSSGTASQPESQTSLLIEEIALLGCPDENSPIEQIRNKPSVLNGIHDMAWSVGRSEKRLDAIRQYVHYSEAVQPVNQASLSFRRMEADLLSGDPARIEQADKSISLVYKDRAIELLASASRDRNEVRQAAAIFALGRITFNHEFAVKLLCEHLDTFRSQGQPVTHRLWLRSLFALCHHVQYVSQARKAIINALRDGLIVEPDAIRVVFRAFARTSGDPKDKAEWSAIEEALAIFSLSANGWPVLTSDFEFVLARLQDALARVTIESGDPSIWRKYLDYKPSFDASDKRANALAHIAKQCIKHKTELDDTGIKAVSQLKSQNRPNISAEVAEQLMQIPVTTLLNDLSTLALELMPSLDDQAFKPLWLKLWKGDDERPATIGLAIELIALCDSPLLRPETGIELLGEYALKDSSPVIREAAEQKRRSLAGNKQRSS